MRCLLAVVPVLSLSVHAAGSLTYTFVSATGTAHASAQVPGDLMRTAGEPYDFGFETNTTYNREFTAGSQSPAGTATATAENQITINRGPGILIFFVRSQGRAGSTNPDGIATADASGAIRYDFTVDVPSAWLMNWQVRTTSAHPGTMSSSLIFERTGETPLVDVSTTDPNFSMGAGNVPLTLMPGTYSVRANVAGMAGVNGSVPAGLDGEGAVLFGITPVPGPGTAAALALLCLGAASPRRRA